MNSPGTLAPCRPRPVIADALNTTYTSEADALKNALDDQNGAMDKVNAALDDFPRNQFGTC
jgi:hypothetical protein